MNFLGRVRCIFGMVLFLAGAQSVLGQHSLPPGFPSNVRLGGVVHGENAIIALGNRLPEVAAFYRKTPDKLRALFRADRSLKADPQGQLFFVCEFQIGTNAPQPGATIENITPTDNSPFSTNETFLLHSRLGASRVIYLDLDGHKDTTGKWGTNAASPPFDLDGNTNSFNNTERDRIVFIWQRVAEDYSMYDIDVTTEDPGIEALRKTSTSDQVYGVRVVIGGSYSDWYGSASGGVAYVGSFDDSKDVPCWVFAQSLGGSEKSIVEAASHEAGHTLGLIHDGTITGSSYYRGQGNWAPIMGVGYYEPIVQWSKGEYADANNIEDDLAVMLNYGAVYRPDDHGNSIASATVLATGSASGVIERNTDLDFFRFTAAGGSVTISVLRAPRDSDLHIQVILYNSAGTAILTNTPADSSSSGTQSAVSTLSLSGGDYYLSVAGVGTGDPLTTGYSDYASLGQYTVTVSGTVSSGSVWLPVAAGTYYWTNTSNWSPAPPNTAGATAFVNNNITGNQTINLPTAVTLGTLNLGDANDTHPFAIRSTGGSLIFDNDSATGNLNKLAGLNDVIAVPLTLASHLTINHSSIGTLTLSGAIGGSGSLAKDGTATTALTGTNSYSGSTAIVGGVLRLDNTNALPAGNLLIAGGVLGLASGDFIDRTTGTGNSQVQWSDDGGFAAYGAPRQVRFSTNSINWNSPNFIGGGITLILGASDSDATLQWLQAINFAGGARTIQVNDGSADIDALISGNMIGGAATNYVTHFIKTGGGTLAITSQPTYWGDTTVSGGTLMLGDGPSDSGGVSQNSTNIDVSAGSILAVNRTGTLTQGSSALPVAISGEGGFAQVGSGTTVFTLSNNYTGLTTISNGTLKLGAANVLPDGAGSGNVTVAVAGTLDLNTFSETINGLSGAGIVATVAGGTPTLTVGNGDVSSVFTGTIRNPAGTLALVKTGTGTLELQGSNTFSGGVTIKNGTVNSRISTTTLGTGTVVMGGAGSTNATYINGKNNTNAFIINAPSSGTNIIGANGAGSGFFMTGPLTLNGNLMVQSYFSSVLQSATARLILNGGMTGTGNLILDNLSGGTNTITLGVNPINPTGSITAQGGSRGSNVISAVIGANVTGVTQNSATCPLILSGANAYTGNTAISAGTVRLTATGSISNSATIIVGTVPGTAAILDVTDAGMTLGAGQTLKGHGTVTGSVTHNGTLAPGTSVGKLTFSGNLVMNGGSTNIFEVNGSTPTNDVVALGGTVTYGGVLNLIPTGAFTNGQKFVLFTGAGATSASNFGSTVGSPGVGLAFSFTNGVLSVVTPAVTSGLTTLTNHYSGGVLTLSWPAGQGWRLQMQTNALDAGLRTNWAYVTDGSVNRTNIPIDRARPTVFYRLVQP